MNRLRVLSPSSSKPAAVSAGIPVLESFFLRANGPCLARARPNIYYVDRGRSDGSGRGRPRPCTGSSATPWPPWSTPSPECSRATTATEEPARARGGRTSCSWCRCWHSSEDLWLNLCFVSVVDSQQASLDGVHPPL